MQDFWRPLKTKSTNHYHRRKRHKANSIENIFNNIIIENFQNLQKEMDIQVRKFLGLQTNKTRASLSNIKVKTLGIQSKVIVLKAVR
jgi:hypothetical protein